MKNRIYFTFTPQGTTVVFHIIALRQSPIRSERLDGMQIEPDEAGGVEILSVSVTEGTVPLSMLSDSLIDEITDAAANFKYSFESDEN